MPTRPTPASTGPICRPLSSAPRPRCSRRHLVETRARGAHLHGRRNSAKSGSSRPANTATDPGGTHTTRRADAGGRPGLYVGPGRKGLHPSREHLPGQAHDHGHERRPQRRVKVCGEQVQAWSGSFGSAGKTVSFTADSAACDGGNGCPVGAQKGTAGVKGRCELPARRARLAVLQRNAAGRRAAAPHHGQPDGQRRQPEVP